MNFTSSFEISVTGGHFVIDPHAHDFRIQVTCTGSLSEGDDSEGMVVDFQKLSDAMNERIRPCLEGRMLVQAGTEAPEDCAMEIWHVPFRPTVERMAEWCLNEVVDFLPANDAEKVRSVTIFENEICSGSCSR